MPISTHHNDRGIDLDEGLNMTREKDETSHTGNIIIRFHGKFTGSGGHMLWV